jgi:hypothetical protein
MAWWRMKALQGLIIGGAPFVLGLLIMIAVAVLDAGRFLMWVGAGFSVLGFLIILRYALAPATCKWIVIVPENRFCVVEDADGYTAEYLEPGRWIVTWRWHAKVHDYVDFNAVTTNAVIADVLGGGGPVADMDVTVVMVFNPAHAESHTYAQLRKMTAREQFEAMIARDVRDSVRKHFRPLTPDQQRSALHNTHALEDIIADQLGHYRTMGLTLASSRPVMVYVRSAPQPLYSPSPHMGPYAPPPAPEPPPAAPPPEPPTLVHIDPPTAEHVSPPEAGPEKSTPKVSEPPPSELPPAPREDVPKVKGVESAQDPLTLRRRRRSREDD